MFPSKKSLAVFLSRLKGFAHPTLADEQYATDSEVAATFLWHAALQGYIEEKTVADFGAGPGILGIGALLLGAKHVVFVEKDLTVKETLLENLAYLAEQTEQTFSYEVVIKDIATFSEQVDVIIMNPPFGTKSAHADKFFLERAVLCAPTILSFHKTITKDFITAFCQDHTLRIAWELPFSYPLKQTHAHHQKKRIYIEVTGFCFTRS
ncbi:MAG: RsmD family RNA methyltransferase [Candidatus Woesearchaeota archaeon]|nr:MAG: RsmD family RNA methyltransferase [Candidatus Woesearchaeota archaeon]